VEPVEDDSWQGNESLYDSEDLDVVSDDQAESGTDETDWDTHNEVKDANANDKIMRFLEGN
jgi:hypothetical protein